MASVIAPGVGFAALARDAARRGPLARLEAVLLQEPGPASRWARVASRLGDTDALVTATVLAGAVHLVNRREAPWRPVALVAGGVLFRIAVRETVRRPRPPQEWWREQPSGWSFPSRHTFNAVLAANVLLDELEPRQRTIALAPSVAVLGLVAASRVRLGVHWPTDVVGALLGGWFCWGTGRRLLDHVGR